ncbi:16S rRNA (adenine(1518)-N(6)/adenine(1519)-N(6))-dimethyltransferase RsmA [Mollicutes bacterium LVI A0039]|nr:16S rRNA (adenine(1518)-N(6)/adenine(1519)-N(6))-dimethyltransferase RsmA [Mollicutes bacterium LVI A0039]
MRAKANKNEIAEANIKLKKSLGQNFLTERNIVEKIVGCANVDKDTNVIEIGPGIGALTELLIEQSKFTTAVEIDQRLIPILNESFGEKDNFELKNIDFLKTTSSEFETHGASKTKVVANLPYYITTAIITKILNEMDFVDEIYIMVQKEVAERICASPRSKQYGSLSVYCQLLCEVNYEFTVKRTVFMPPPNVDSAIISLKRSITDCDIVAIEKFVQNAFKQKRKTLVNNLNKAYGVAKPDLSAFLENQGFKQSVRAEEISPEQYIKLQNAFTMEFLND